MEEVKRIYILLSHSEGLKIKDIAKELDLDIFYVADIMFSTDNIPYWYQNDDSLWFAKEGAIEIEEKPEDEKDELIVPVEIPQRFNINRFLQNDISDSLRAYLYLIPKYRVYSNEEILQLFKRYRKGDKKAFELIVKSQQRFVANIAFLYCRKGASLEDIIQEGNIGLIKAIERFDETQYHSFSNFAKSWILQAISISMITIPFMVRLPLNIIYQYRKIRKFKEKFEQVHENPPSVIDIETDEDLDFDKITFLSQYPDSLSELVEITDNLDYLESDSNLATFYEDNEYNSYLVQKLINRLKKNESRILRHYYGIGVVEETISSIGDEMNLSRERVRQILWSSVRKLQDVSHIKIEEAKIGEMIRIDSSNQLGRVVNTKQGADGSTILIVKMYSGFTMEISLYDTPYHIIKRVKSQERQKQISKSYQKTSVTEYTRLKQVGERSLNKKTPKEVTKYADIKVGDQIFYNRKYCIVKKIIESSKSVKLFIEYSNGVMDVVSYNRTKFEKLSKSSDMIIERTSSARTQITNQKKREAMVGDRIKYQSMNCTVIKKKVMRGSFRLIVRYDDGRVDNLLNDWSKYIILNR